MAEINFSSVTGTNCENLPLKDFDMRKDIPCPTI